MPELPPSPSADTAAGAPTGQTKGIESAPPAHAGTTPTSGRLAFRSLHRELSDDDLRDPGVQKLLLELTDRAEAECENLRVYVERFHAADKQVAVLEAGGRTNVAIEVMFGVGVGVGSSMVTTLAPYFWNDQPKGYICLVLGAALVIGAIIARVKKQ